MFTFLHQICTKLKSKVYPVIQCAVKCATKIQKLHAYFEPYFWKTHGFHSLHYRFPLHRKRWKTCKATARMQYQGLAKYALSNSMLHWRTWPRNLATSKKVISLIFLTSPRYEAVSMRWRKNSFSLTMYWKGNGVSQDLTWTNPSLASPSSSKSRVSGSL